MSEPVEGTDDAWAPVTARRAHLFIMSGPSGAGKSTIVKRLLAETGLWHSVSMTTRPPREGEVDGVDYVYVSREAFSRAVEAGEMIEHATVHGELYGTPRRPVEERLASGTDVLLDVDVQGARAVRSAIPEAVLVFVAAPSREVLEDRLRSRRSETEEKVLARMRRADEEMRHASEYDYLVVNEELDRAVADATAVVAAERMRIARRRRAAN